MKHLAGLAYVGGEDHPSASPPSTATVIAGDFAAVLCLGTELVAPVHLRSSDISAALREIIGDERVAIADVSPASGVAFWLGTFEMPEAELNLPATTALTWLWQDVADGRFPAAEADLTRARAGHAPVVKGPCIVTGLAAKQGFPRLAGLPPTFWSWLQTRIQQAPHQPVVSELQRVVEPKG